jgi:hypothetical protein
MSVLVFAGPSLPSDFDLGGAERRPPVKRGDILDALNRPLSAIGLIDGALSERATLWPKEIIAALAAGVRLVGGGTLGALWAAQLADFGADGVGEVFEGLVSGRLRGLEDIAPLDRIEQERLVRIGRPLVDLLDLIERAQKTRMISSAAARAMEAVARRLDPTERRYESLFERAHGEGIDMGVIDALAALGRNTKESPCERDARLVVERLRGAPATAPRAEPRFDPRAVPDTIALDRLRSLRDLERVDPALRIRLESESVTDAARPRVEPLTRAGEPVKAIRKKVLLRLLASRELDRLGARITRSEAQTTADDVRRFLGLTRRDDFEAWLRAEGMAPAEFFAIMWDMAAVNKCEQWHGSAIDRALPGHIAVNAAFDWAVKRGFD